MGGCHRAVWPGTGGAGCAAPGAGLPRLQRKPPHEVAVLPRLTTPPRSWRSPQAIRGLNPPPYPARLGACAESHVPTPQGSLDSAFPAAPPLPAMLPQRGPNLQGPHHRTQHASLLPVKSTLLLPATPAGMPSPWASKTFRSPLPPPWFPRGSSHPCKTGAVTWPLLLTQRSLLGWPVLATSSIPHVEVPPGHLFPSAPHTSSSSPKSACLPQASPTFRCVPHHPPGSQNLRSSPSPLLCHWTHQTTLSQPSLDSVSPRPQAVPSAGLRRHGHLWSRQTCPVRSHRPAC